MNNLQAAQPAADMAPLCDELANYCVDQGLPYRSADELVVSGKVTAEQRAWLEAYIGRWDSSFGSL